jgi:outer membrane protein assembly factor BamA
VWALLVVAMTLHATTDETITAIQIHGNLVTSDAEVRRLADVRDGMPFEPTTVTDVTERLRATGRFKSVQVLKRFASISDSSQILLVIIVDEGPVHIEMTGDPDHPTRVVRNRGSHVMILPVLSIEDGYGATYGARLAFPNPAGKRSRIAFPLTWGGSKQAAAEFEKSIERGPIDRVSARGSVLRTTNPFFERDDDRIRVAVRGERQLVKSLRAGAGIGWQDVSFGPLEDRFVQIGADVIYDTRLDPGLPRNAVYGRAAWDHLDFGNGPASPTHTAGSVNRLDLEGRGYLAVFKQNILAVRALRRDSDDPLPPYLQPLLGGMANLRGFKAGIAVGDTLVATSVELIVPLSPALQIGKIGVTAFVDYGTVYPKGEHFGDRPMLEGYGGSVWVSAAFFRFNFAVAHGRGASTRVHVGGDLSF